MRLRTAYWDSNEDVLTTSNAVGANQWVHIKVQQTAGSTIMTIDFNGVRSTNNSVTRTFQITTATNKVGDTGVQFKDTLIVQGNHYPSSLNNATLDMNSINGNGSNYQGVTHVEISTQEVTWV